MKQLKGVISVCLSLACIGSIANLMADKRLTVSAKAESQAALEQISLQLSDLERFPLFLSPSQGSVTAADDRLSATQISTPSFSWIRDQVSDRLGSETLIEQWQAYRTTEGFQYVDVVVNENQWNQLRYFSQYGFILQFGTVAQANHYHLRVFHSGDATNQLDAISLQNTRDQADAERATGQRTSNRLNNRAVRLRGSYFCESTTAVADLPPVSATSASASASAASTSERLPACRVFVAL